jgi:hypothetical protein
MLDLHDDPTVGRGNDRVRDPPHARAPLTYNQR